MLAYLSHILLPELEGLEEQQLDWLV